MTFEPRLSGVEPFDCVVELIGVAGRRRQWFLDGEERLLYSRATSSKSAMCLRSLGSAFHFTGAPGTGWSSSQLVRADRTISNVFRCLLWATAILLSQAKSTSYELPEGVNDWMNFRIYFDNFRIHFANFAFTSLN